MITKFQDIISSWFTSIQFESADSKYIAAWLLFMVGIALSYGIYYLSQWLLSAVLRKINNRKGSLMYKAILDRKVLRRFSYIPALIILNICVHTFFSDHAKTLAFFSAIMNIFSIGATVSIIASILNVLEDMYNQTKFARQGSIKGILQAIKTVMFIIAAIFMICLLAGVKLQTLLGTLAGASAVLMLVFRDPILGLVGGIQLSLNKMVLPGDWIEMPAANADGDVEEISQITVKVRNFDNTITTIPTYDLISKPVKNWRGMFESGGRRIKRAIYIDMNSVMFCTDEMLKRFRKIEYIADYIDNKEKEIEKHNDDRKINEKLEVNGRRQTNLGVFRAYLSRYLHNHPRLNHDFTVMVRQLQSGNSGIPLEIYVFTDTTKWREYEDIQSDIFDHIIAAVPYFNLRIFQEPSDHAVTSINAASSPEGRIGK
ncbi:MAG: mechanosensitive ion channel family protein [Bacteroidales bacterium]|jgi:miniconductance mechanosensitive channel|nr:mechanosensitive ion channel family protein [Bacteroidales bacterium]